MEFGGRSIVITGVGRAGQVGQALAEAFASRGARVFLVDRQADEAQGRADAILATGGRAAALSADLGDAASVATLAERLREATGGRVHALVHVVGGFAMSGPVAESDEAVWHRMLAMNATTAYLTARAFLPLLRAARGSLVFFASEAVLPGARTAEMSAYAASKAALASLTQSIAQEEAEHGVRANAVAPAAMKTAANLETMPNARLISREDVARVVLWLCSDDATLISGQVIPVR